MLNVCSVVAVQPFVGIATWTVTGVGFCPGERAMEGRLDGGRFFVLVLTLLGGSTQ